MSQSRQRTAPTDIAVNRACSLIGRIETIPILLRGLVKVSGLRFAAVAHVTDDHWVACAVCDQAGFGLKEGDHLDVDTTLCKEVRKSREAIVIRDSLEDPLYRSHPTPKLYRFRGYISVPIRLPDGTYYGNLCALDPEPLAIEPSTLTHVTELLADLIARRIAGEIEREIDLAATLRAHDDTRRMRALDQEAVDRLQDAVELAATTLQDERTSRKSEREDFAEERAGDLARVLAAEEQSSLRDEFIAVLGHDLRNPLAAIVTYSELLKHDDSGLMRTSLANRISISAKRMGDMIANVMSFTRIRIGGSLPIELNWVANLSQALAHTAEEVRDAHPSREVAIHVDPMPPVRADAVRVQQLASNLLGNAITHGEPTRPIHFLARWMDGELTLSVENGGTPIPAERQARLFQPFQKGERQQHGEGLGLGLHIGSQVAHAHGGTLTVASNERATRFTARLPLKTT